MAMAKPVPSAQLGCVMTCDLCDSVEDVNSFCKNCLQNLCDNCKKLHQKIPSLRSHDIGSIGDGRRINQNKDLLCSDHGEILTYCCKTCSVNVCPKCLSNHLKHDLLNIDEEGQRMKEELEKILESKSKLLEEISNSRAKMLQHKARFDSKEEDVISKIDGEFEMILKLKKEMRDAVIGKNAEGRGQIEEKIHAAQNFESKLKEEMRRIKEELPFHSGSSLIKFAQEGSEKLSAVETPPCYTSQLPNAIEPSLQPLSKFVEHSKQIAEIIRCKIAMILPDRILSEDLIILSSFSLKSSILDIVYDKENKVWVTCHKAQEIQQLDCKGTVFKKIKMVPNSVYMAKGNDGNVFVTSGSAKPFETNIRILYADEFVSIFSKLTNVDRLYSLAFDDFGFLFCHARLSQNDCLLKLDEVGKMIWRTELGRQSFNLSSITFSPNRVCYIALGASILLIGSDGHILKRKEWDSKLGKLGPILFDKHGFMFAGTGNGVVHILSEDLEYVVKTYISDLLKNSFINALACDSQKRLWIGNEKGLVCVTKYTYE